MNRNKGLKSQCMNSILDVHKLIVSEHTGGQNAFAEKLHMTPPTLNRRLHQLEFLGAVIGYDKIRRTYYYKNNFDIKLEVTYD